MSTQQQGGASTTVGEAGPSLIDEILAESRIKPKDDGYEVAKRGVEEFISQMLAPKHANQKVEKSALEAMIAEIDKRLTSQVNEILHHPEVQKMESAWRSLKYMVDRFDFRQNTQLEVLNVSKDALEQDFADYADITQSGLYKLAYTNEYGQHGGDPYGMIVGNYDFGPGPQDMGLLRQCASVSAMAHAPFITNANAEFFGLDHFGQLQSRGDLKDIMNGPRYAQWQAFRDSEDARYVGLCLPRFMLRLPYGPDANPVKAFSFTEDVVDENGNARDEKYLWGHASAAFATRVADSFAKYRWCPNIIGPQSGGTVEDLPLHNYKSGGDLQTRAPTEMLIPDRREYEFSEEGFIPLVNRKGHNDATFFSASSAQRSVTKMNKDEETSFRLGTQLPYTFVITRLAHYLKVMQRQQLGSSKGAPDLQRELSEWIRNYTSDMDNPGPDVRAKRPLRKAEIRVEEVPGEAGWYRCMISVSPHFKYMGASFTLSLVGKLDTKG